MRKLASFTAASALAAFGFAGAATAQTQLLVNPDAETLPAMTGWNHSTNVDAVTNQPQTSPDALPKAGARFFTFADSSEAAAGGPPTSMDQDVDVSGCNVEALGLYGTFSAGGYVQTEALDEGMLDVEFFDGVPSSLGTTSQTGIKFPQPGGNLYQAFGVMGNIPSGAVTANYMVAGVLLSGTFVNLFLDDLELVIDCVESTAKISGKLASDGKRPTHTFGGAVGLLEGGDTAAGSEIIVSYKKSAGFAQNTACTFVEGTGTTAIVGDTTTLTDWSYTCSDGRDTSGETADITLVDRSTDTPRGSIDLDADDNQLDVSDDLKTGNVIVIDGS